MTTPRPTAEQFDEAQLLIRHEFDGLDAHAQYFNAFARLLKWDPLGRVTMLGTDQRDQFVPVVRAALAARPRRPQRILDVGCGDGATFQLFADAVPDGSTADILDPNADYVAAAVARLGHYGNVRLGSSHVSGFVPDPGGTHFSPPLGGSYDVILVLHCLYFFDDLEAAFADLYRRLASGGLMIVVFADESIAYTGVCYRAYVDTLDPRLAADHTAICAERLALFEGGETPRLKATLGAEKVETQRQPTRLFGHSLADIIALSNIAGLSGYDGVEKYDAALGLLTKAPERLGFRVEIDDGSPRLGMLSVQQPQLVCRIEKPA